MKAPADVHAAYGWPPRLVMYLACAYTGRSRWTLARAARSGILPTAGRNGRSLVFDRDALDAWMVNGGRESVDKTLDAALTSAPCRQTGSSSADALARLRVLRKAGV
jgi:hypothetical protein